MLNLKGVVMNLNLFTKILVVIFALSASFSIYEIKAPEQDLLRTPLLAEGMEIKSIVKITGLTEEEVRKL